MGPSGVGVRACLPQRRLDFHTFALANPSAAEHRRIRARAPPPSPCSGAALALLRRRASPAPAPRFPCSGAALPVLRRLRPSVAEPVEQIGALLRLVLALVALAAAIAA